MRIPKGVAAIAALIAGFGLAVHAANAGVLAANHPAQVDTLTAAGNADPNMGLVMELTLSLRNEAQLDRLLEEQQDPNSPHYRHWLTSAQFNRKFGARQSDADAVAKWLADNGFTVVSAKASDGYIKFSGSVAQAQQAFGVRIARFAGDSFANTSDPQIPSQFDAMIAAVVGLDNMVKAVPASSSVWHARPGSLVPRSSAAKREPMQLAALENASPMPSTSRSASPDVRIGGTTAFGPSDLRTFYNEGPLLGSATGSGQCVAIVGVSDISDTAVSGFNSEFGLPATSLTRKQIDGGAPRTGDDSELEAELDVEWSHAAAPGAPINLYISADPANGLVDTIASAVSDNACGVISISFGFCGGSKTLYTKTLGTPFKKAAAQGQSVFVSSGDQGAAGIVFVPGLGCVIGNSRNPSEMAANPNVTAVGGTGFDPNYDNNGNDVGNVPERVWNDGGGGGAGGGGISNIFAKPSYQAAGTPKDKKRDIPDISLIASPIHPGVFLDNEAIDFNTGIVCCIGGTSLSSPVWAGFTRVISQYLGARLGNINPAIYQFAGQGLGAHGLRDVISGNNDFNGVQGFPAVAGYDRATGWGTVDVTTFANSAIGKIILSPATLNFGRLTNGSVSPKAKPAKLSSPKANKFPGKLFNVQIVSDPGTPNGAFIPDQATTTCGNGPITAKPCNIGVKFAPPQGQLGSMSAKLRVTDNGSNSPQTITLKGISK